MKPLLDILADINIKKIGIDLKSAKIVLDRLGVPLEGIFFDVGVAAYLLDPGSRSYDLEDLCMEWLDLALPGYETVVVSLKNNLRFIFVLHERSVFF